MEFGWSLPSRGPLANRDILLKLAQKAEQLRYSSIFVSDHIVLPTRSASPYPYHPSGQFPGGSRQDYLEPLTLLTYLAAATKKIRLGTSVLIIPYRNPVHTAKTLATLDVLSGGRIILGCGVGWWEEEFVALGLTTFQERGRVTDEYLQIFKSLWTQEEPRFDGRYHRFADLTCWPRPIQKPHIPFWIGGHTEPAVRRAARLGDAWHPIGLRPPADLSPRDFAGKVKRLHQEARKAGRDPKEIALTFRAPLGLAKKGAKSASGERSYFHGTPEEVIKDIRTYQALGVRHFVFDFTVPDPKGMMQTMARFAKEVRPKVVHPRG